MDELICRKAACDPSGALSPPDRKTWPFLQMPKLLLLNVQLVPDGAYCELPEICDSKLLLKNCGGGWMIADLIGFGSSEFSVRLSMKTVWSPLTWLTNFNVWMPAPG